MSYPHRGQNHYRCYGRYQEVRGEKLEECCKEQGQLAEVTEEGLG